jgi:NADP-dependent 3-hydroxy acid dehydrogenase YdfG
VERLGTGVYALTRFGIIAFAESLHQEHVKRHVSVVEPGTVDTELVSYLREDVGQAARSQVGSIEALWPDNIADAVSSIVTHDCRMATNEMLLRAAEQDW